MAKKNQLTTSDYLSVDELKRLMKSLRKDNEYIWELYVRLSFSTALRASDVLSLTWEEILCRSYFIKREQKTGKTRKIPINDYTQKCIEEMYIIADKPNPSEVIFKSKITGLPFTIQYVNHKIKKWKEKYNIKIGNFSTHTFRKSFGRYVYDSAVDKSEALVLLNKIFKHTAIETTKVYIGLREEEIQSVFESINI